jgi:hypothetical protein
MKLTKRSENKKKTLTRTEMRVNLVVTRRGLVEICANAGI